MTNEETRARCKALTKAGDPCKNYALPDSEYCHVHRGVAVRQSVDIQEEVETPAAVDVQRPVGERIEAELSDEELREELIAELDELTERVQTTTPDYEPPPFSPQRFIALIEELLEKLPGDIRLDILEQLRGALNQDLIDMEVLKGVWYMLNYTAQYNVDMVKRRFSGEYDTDEWGLDWEFLDATRPFFTFLYKVYFRVQTTGLENIPIEGRALMVANHSGQIPWDGTMVGTAVLIEHPAQRLVRTLYATWFPRVPFFSSWLVRMGQTLATVDNGTRLLEQDELVAVFPEGYKGIGKLYKHRYQLARFGQGGFVKMALSTQSPIIPVSVVGAEETYISLAKSSTMASITGLPYVPVTPTFPWLGLLGLVPLPAKWYIDFGEPLPVDGYGPEGAENLILVSQLTDQVRNVVQEMVNERLAQRRSVFL
jgi:1-acyl-sn-glycerol-3-phosphate acyltransferase